ncbi:MAG: DNA replication and repair protein RecF [Treponema sp.]|jgi:DNA replication and repair protein RecF|nr:DNA replication and repair protein RecF [Treponema sp.]
MIFYSLNTVFFRNLADAELFVKGKDIFLVGENGQGKTNFLEALYVAAYGASFRGSGDGELARTGEKNYAVRVKIGPGPGDEPGLLCHELHIKYEKPKKTVFLDGKRVEDRRELLSVVPCVVFCHEDMEFVSGSPERRRWFFDQSLSLCDTLYLDDLRNFRRVLKSRNVILRERGPGQSSAKILDALDPQVAIYGLKLMEQREKTVGIFSALFEPLYREVSGIDGITIRYVPSWKSRSVDEVCAFLAERREADFTAGLSLSGPHRDRYVFCRGTDEFAGKASTGQRRLLALLLRVAQARCFSGITGKNPVLLLDDVLLEMDGEKRRRFLAVMPAYDQAFYTFLPEEPYEHYNRPLQGAGGDREAGTLVYYVENGVLRGNDETGR